MASFKIEIRVSGKGLRRPSLEALLGEFKEEMDRRLNLTSNGFGVVKINTKPSRSDRLSEARDFVENGKSIAEELKDEMQNWYDNLPENLQGSDKGSQVEECASALEQICSDLENIDFDSIEFPGMY